MSQTSSGPLFNQYGHNTMASIDSVASNPFRDSSTVVGGNSSFESQDPFATRNNSIISTVDPRDSYNNPHIAVPDEAYVPEEQRPRRGTFGSIVDTFVPDAVQRKLSATNYSGLTRKGSMHGVLEKARVRGVQLQRKKWVQILFEYAIYAFLLVFVYFVLVGVPLWNGAVWWLWWVVSNKFVFSGGWGITLGLALL